MRERGIRTMSCIMHHASRLTSIQLALLLALALTTACAGRGPEAPAATAAATAGQFTNPVIDRDFPDPDVLRVGDAYYAYATNAGGVNVQAARSPDLVRWQA